MRDDGVADVVIVPQRKAIASRVEGIPVLGVPGYRLQLQLIGSKTEVRAEVGDVEACEEHAPFVGTAVLIFIG